MIEKLICAQFLITIILILIYKKEEGKGSIKKVFPAVEFSVNYDKKVLHIITIFDDADEEKIKKIQNEIFDINNNKPLYDDDETRSFSEGKYLNIIKNIGVNVVMIAHQKETLSSGRCVVCYKR